MDDRDRIDILLNEYNTLRNELLLYQNSLRSIHLMIFTLLSASLASLATEKLIMLAIIFPPIFLITIAYGLNDLFQLFMIAKHIEVIEDKINKFANYEAFTWETKTAKLIHSNFKKDSHLPLFFIRPSVLGDSIVAIFAIPLFFLATFRGFNFIKVYFNVFANVYLILNIVFFLLVGFYCIYFLFFGLKKLEKLFLKL